ncbi:hypothetical protein AAVH_41472, partial [Aphelenchoides avenae]
MVTFHCPGGVARTLTEFPQLCFRHTVDKLTLDVRNRSDFIRPVRGLDKGTHIKSLTLLGGKANSMDAYRQYMTSEHPSRDGIPDHFASIPEKLVRKLLFEMHIDVLLEKCFQPDSLIGDESLKTFAKNGMTTRTSQTRCSAGDDGILEFAFGDLQDRVQARSLTLILLEIGTRTS